MVVAPVNHGMAWHEHEQVWSSAPAIIIIDCTACYSPSMNKFTNDTIWETSFSGYLKLSWSWTAVITFIKLYICIIYIRQ